MYNSNDSQNPRVLVWSLRNIHNFAYNSCLFEFEDIIADIDSVDIHSAPQYDFRGKVINRLVEGQTKRLKSLAYTNPYRQSYDVEHEYDIFFSIFDFPVSVASINSIKDIPKKCKYSVCYIIEIWNKDLPKLRNFLEYFSRFDLILVGHADVVENVRKITGRPCEYLAPGVNTTKFYPDLNKNRSFDVCSLGRRSPITHKALLALAEDQKISYYYDIEGGSRLRNNSYQEYRTYIANILKSSRYFIANHAKIDQPDKTNGQQEIGYRFFEGAAAGNILIGKPPQSEVFDHYFDWPNAVIPMEFGSTNIENLITDLDSKPALLKKIQLDNVVNSLRKHDWVFRWEQVLKLLGLAPMQAMENRKSHLEKIAQSCLYQQGEHINNPSQSGLFQIH